MLPANLQATLKALALTDRPLITAAADKNAAHAARQFQLGQQLQGTVQAQASSNLFNVRVAGQLLQMQLPAFIKAGDTIALQVASLQPRLTFTLAASSNPVSTPESLSAAARLLSSLSQQPLERSYVRPIQSAPLWAEAALQPDASQLAGKLHDALCQSGLFYESHQAQWVAGMRPTSDLLLEPQNQLPLGMEATGRQGSAAPGVPEHLQTLVQQQLNALENRQVLWQGPVWQGQEMRWEVREESPQRNAQGVEEGQWHTRIDLELPHLGSVSARLSFNGNTLNLALDVADAQTRDKLGGASSQLVAALSERGIHVAHTQVTRHEHAR